MKETSRGDYKKDHVNNNPKTIQAISCIMCLIECGEAKKVLILCKKSLRYQWKNEIEKFTEYDQDKVLIINGTPKQKEKVYKKFLEMEEGVLISNYDVVVSDMDTKMLDSIKPQLLVIDEAHTLRGHNTIKNKKISKIAKDIRYKILLTGTPMASKPDDLYGVMKIMNKDFFGLKKDFDNKFLNYEYGKFGKQLVGYKHLDELEELTHNIMIGRSEKEVELDLPEVLPPNRLYLNMDNTQLKIQDAIESEKKQLGASINTYQESIKKLQSEGSGGNTNDKLKKLNDNIKIASDVMKGLQTFLQMNADDPRVFTLASEKIKEKYGSFVPNSYDMSPKTEALLGIVEDILESNQKVIIFSMYEREVQLLKKDLEDKLKINVVTYTGSVGTDDREKNVRLFTTNDDYNVFVATSAAQEGLNLQCANNVIHYNQTHIIADKIQRNGRARRVGSKYKNVFIYDLLTKDTVDEKKIEKLDNEEKLLSNVTGNNEARSKAIIENM